MAPWPHLQAAVEIRGFLGFYSTPVSKVLATAPGVTTDLRKLMDSFITRLFKSSNAETH